MNTNIYALLIGIDCYPTTLTATHPRSINLAGCVSDVNRIEAFLRQEIGLPPAQILKLSSTNTAAGTPLEPPEKQPTRANIVNGFQWLEETAKAGDHVFIYYSGHGARVKTPLKFQSLKPGDGFDEALVPSDYNFETDRFLRDFELARILSGFSDRGFEVTIILDSCHSGGSTRAELGEPESGPQTRVRSIGQISQTFPDPETPVASDYDLQATIMKLSGRTRDFNVEHGWLLEPQGYVLLAACRPAEFAYEHPFDGKEVRGVLTYCLLDSLQNLGPQASFQSLYNRILAQVHELFPNQTPQLQGERDRALFTHERVTTAATIPVLGVNGKEIMLSAGQAQRIKPGQQFAIFAAGETNFASGVKRAEVRVTEVGASSSRAEIVNQFNGTPIEKGDQALPIDSGLWISKRSLTLDQTDSPEVAQALKGVEEALRLDQNDYLTLSNNGVPADFALSVSAANEYVITARVGKESRNVPTGLSLDNEHAPSLLIKQLGHIAKYLNVYELENYDSISPSRVKISAQLLGVQSEYLLGDKPAPEPLPENQLPPEFKTGQWTFLQITNESSQVLNITVLDLRPNWSISQIYPAGAASSEPIDPGLSVTLPLRASLPANYDSGDDLFKIVATAGPSTFRFLELSPLPGPENQRDWAGEPPSQLEALRNAFGRRTRDYDMPSTASSEWTSADVKLRTRRL